MSHLKILHKTYCIWAYHLKSCYDECVPRKTFTLSQYDCASPPMTTKSSKKARVLEPWIVSQFALVFQHGNGLLSFTTMTALMVRLPFFLSDHSDIRFTYVEACFPVANITSQQARSGHLLSAHIIWHFNCFLVRYCMICWRRQSMSSQRFLNGSICKCSCCQQRAWVLLSITFLLTYKSPS